MTNAQFSWREALESFRVMKSAFTKRILSLTDGLTKEWCIAIHLFWVSCRRIAKRSGLLFLSLYLKQVRVVLQKFVAGDLPPSVLSPAVSLTRGGIPRKIPSFHRKRIKEGDHRLLKFYLFLLSVSKIIELAPAVSKGTFTSVVSPSDLDRVLSMTSKMRSSIRPLLTRYIPGLASVPLHLGLASLRRTFGWIGSELIALLYLWRRF